MTRTEWKGKAIIGYRVEYTEFEVAAGRNDYEKTKFAVLEDGTEVDTRDIANSDFLDWLHSNTRN